MTTKKSETPPSFETRSGIPIQESYWPDQAAPGLSDPEAARAKGFEHVLVHGMLTLAFAGRAVVETACGADSTRLKRLAARFSSPVYLVPGQAIATTLWSLDGSGDRARYGFESTDASGRIVLAHGLAEVAS